MTLVWLGLRLLEQDKAIAAQRALDRRELAADRASRVLEQLVSEIDRHLVSGTAPEGAAWIRLAPSEISVEPAGAAPWVPNPPQLAEAETSAFRVAEVLEFRGDAGKALTIYETLARSSHPPVRAGALLRLARVHRGTRRVDAALAAYRQLGKIEGVAFDGMPADLLARRAVCDLLAEDHRTRDLASEAEALRVGLLGGRWTVDRVAWTLAAEQTARWTETPLVPSDENLLVAEAAEWLWEQTKRPDGLTETGSRVLAQEHAAVTLLRRRKGGRIVHPRFSPDGEWLAYQLGAFGLASTGPRPLQIMLRSTRTGRERALLAGGGLHANWWGELNWFPDGAQLLVAALTDGGATSTFYRVDVKTGDATPFEKNIFNHAQISMEGDKIFFAGQSTITVRDLVSGESRPLYRSPTTHMMGLALSRDGRNLAFIEPCLEKGPATALMILPTSGGSARVLAQFPEGLWAPQPDWTPDGRFIFAGNWRVDTATGKAERLAGMDAPIYNVTIHPNGDRTAFGLLGPRSTEMWLLENYLR